MEKWIKRRKRYKMMAQQTGWGKVDKRRRLACTNESDDIRVINYRGEKYVAVIQRTT